MKHVKKNAIPFTHIVSLNNHDHNQKFIDLQAKQMPDWIKWKERLEKIINSLQTTTEIATSPIPTSRERFLAMADIPKRDALYVLAHTFHRILKKTGVKEPNLQHLSL